MNRGSQRYLLVRFLASEPITERVAQQAVYRSIEEMFGSFGSAEISARMVSFDEASAHGVFRCKTGSVERLRAALALMTHIDGSSVAAMVLRSSGTIKGLKVRFKRHR